MTTDFAFLKLYTGDAGRIAATSVLQWFDDQCSEHGLVSVPQEDQAHLSVLLITGNGRWIHLDTLGHFLPEATKVLTVKCLDNGIL